MSADRRRDGQSDVNKGMRPSIPIEKRGGYTPQGQGPRPTSPPPKPSDSKASAKPS